MNKIEAHEQSEKEVARFYFWAEGETEDEKMYFENEKKFLEYITANDPGICGADEMTPAEFAKLPALS